MVMVRSKKNGVANLPKIEFEVVNATSDKCGVIALGGNFEFDTIQQSIAWAMQAIDSVPELTGGLSTNSILSSLQYLIDFFDDEEFGYFGVEYLLTQGLDWRGGWIDVCRRMQALDVMRVLTCDPMYHSMRAMKSNYGDYWQGQKFEIKRDFSCARQHEMFFNLCQESERKGTKAVITSRFFSNHHFRIQIPHGCALVTKINGKVINLVAGEIVSCQLLRFYKSSWSWGSEYQVYMAPERILEQFTRIPEAEVLLPVRLLTPKSGMGASDTLNMLGTYKVCSSVPLEWFIDSDVGDEGSYCGNVDMEELRDIMNRMSRQFYGDNS